jgi:hypothetical protein
MSLRASLNGLAASTRYRLTMNLATNQRAQRRDRTNVYVCHVDHLLQLPVGSSSARAAHRSRAPKLIFQESPRLRREGRSKKVTQV